MSSPHIAFQIAVEGSDADAAMKELLALEGLQAERNEDAQERVGEVLAAIATVYTIVDGSVRLLRWIERRLEQARTGKKPFRITIQTPDRERQVLLETDSDEELARELEKLAEFLRRQESNPSS